MKCAKCGSENSNGITKCPACGQSLAGRAASAVGDTGKRIAQNAAQSAKNQVESEIHGAISRFIHSIINSIFRR